MNKSKQISSFMSALYGERYLYTKSSVTVFGRFSVGLARTGFCSKQKHKAVLQEEILSGKSKDCRPVSFVGDSFCHFPAQLHWIDECVQKYRRATTASFPVVCEDI